MGLFKDLRALRKQSRQMQQDAGMGTGLLGLVKATPGLVAQATETLHDVQEGQAEGARLLAEGRPGTARLVAVRDTGTTIGTGAQDNPVAELDLDVRLDGRDPYRATVTQLIPRLAVGRLVPGSELPVKVDRNDPQKLVVDWEAPVEP